ncbi:Peptidase C45 [Trinorchestia longiramus]|nr:Peptidase C45 [Trinorchestia longiramus]
MLLHLGRQVLGEFQGPKEDQKPPHGCSSVCSNYDGRPLLGHAEDALAAVLNHIYIVSAHVTEEEPQGRYGTRSEGFTALCYAGYLPGFCMGYNHHGFVFSINVLFPTDVQADKTAPYFMTRALLAARTLEEAEVILRDPGVGAGDGFSVNMSFTCQVGGGGGVGWGCCGSGACEGSILFHNAEVAPPLPGQLESQISVLTVNTGEHVVHANKYLRLAVEEDKEFEDASSTHRQQRAQCCKDPDSKITLLELLSDTQDKEYPIFREGQDDIYTVTVGIFDLREKTWTFYMKNPQMSDQLTSLPLVFKWNS